MIFPRPRPAPPRALRRIAPARLLIAESGFVESFVANRSVLIKAAIMGVR